MKICESNQSLLSAARQRYESEKKERELELIEKDNKLNKLKLKKSNLIISIFAIVLFFIITVVVLFIQISKIKLNPAHNEPGFDILGF